MRIELDKLEGKASAFSHAYAPGELQFHDERLRLTRPPEISGRISRKGATVALKGCLSARAEVDCDRCLKAIAFPVSVDFSLQYITAEDYESSHAAELEEAEMMLSVFDGQAIDIDEIVREQVLLAVPARALCREDCQGLCPVCGGDRNVNECSCQEAETDPRWAALKDFRF